MLELVRASEERTRQQHAAELARLRAEHAEQIKSREARIAPKATAEQRAAARTSQKSAKVIVSALITFLDGHRDTL